MRFSSLTFKLSEDDAVILTKTFPSLSLASAYFNSHLLDLGKWTNNGSGALDVMATLSETISGSGNGYGINFLAGPPAAALRHARCRSPRRFRCSGWDCSDLDG